jgi:hypothetical protein
MPVVFTAIVILIIADIPREPGRLLLVYSHHCTVEHHPTWFDHTGDLPSRPRMPKRFHLGSRRTLSHRRLRRHISKDRAYIIIEFAGTNVLSLFHSSKGSSQNQSTVPSFTHTTVPFGASPLLVGCEEVPQLVVSSSTQMGKIAIWHHRLLAVL